MTENARTPIRIDVACPWCYIGRRNLDSAIATVAGDDDAPRVEITYHSFELARETPVDVGVDSVGFVAERMGVGRDEAEAMNDRVTRIAKEQAGLEYRLDLQQYTNTAKAHELTHFAKAHGTQHEMTEHIMAAHFTKGRHIGHLDELVALATEVGLDGADARAALETGRYRDAVLADQDQGRAHGLDSVPFVLIDERHAVKGTQSAEALADIVRQAWAERRTA